MAITFFHAFFVLISRSMSHRMSVSIHPEAQGPGWIDVHTDRPRVKSKPLTWVRINAAFYMVTYLRRIAMN